MNEIDRAEASLRRGLLIGFLAAMPIWLAAWTIAAWLWSR